MELVQIYFKNLNKLAVITNFLAFFMNADPDPVMKMNVDPDPQPWFGL